MQSQSSSGVEDLSSNPASVTQGKDLSPVLLTHKRGLSEDLPCLAVFSTSHTTGYQVLTMVSHTQ